MACPRCGASEPHFVPPSFGEEGFFVCEHEKRGAKMRKKRYPMLFVARYPEKGRWAVYERRGPAPDQVRRVSMPSTQLGAYRVLEALYNGVLPVPELHQPTVGEEDINDSQA